MLLSSAAQETCRLVKTFWCPQQSYWIWHWLSLKVKTSMKGQHFESTQDIEAVNTEQLTVFTKDTARTASERGKSGMPRWDMCV